MSLIPVLGSLMQANLCEFKATLVCRVSSRVANTTQINPVSKKANQNKVIQIVCVGVDKYVHVTAVSSLVTLYLMLRLGLSQTLKLIDLSRVAGQ